MQSFTYSSRSCSFMAFRSGISTLLHLTFVEDFHFPYLQGKVVLVFVLFVAPFQARREELRRIAQALTTTKRGEYKIVANVISGYPSSSSRREHLVRPVHHIKVTRCTMVSRSGCSMAQGDGFLGQHEARRPSQREQATRKGCQLELPVPVGEHGEAEESQPVFVG